MLSACLFLNSVPAAWALSAERDTLRSRSTRHTKAERELALEFGVRVEPASLSVVAPVAQPAAAPSAQPATRVRSAYLRLSDEQRRWINDVVPRQELTALLASYWLDVLAGLALGEHTPEQAIELLTAKHGIEARAAQESVWRVAAHWTSGELVDWRDWEPIPGSSNLRSKFHSTLIARLDPTSWTYDVFSGALPPSSKPLAGSAGSLSDKEEFVVEQVRSIAQLLGGIGIDVKEQEPGKGLITITRPFSLRAYELLQEIARVAPVISHFKAEVDKDRLDDGRLVTDLHAEGALFESLREVIHTADEGRAATTPAPPSVQPVADNTSEPILLIPEIGFAALDEMEQALVTSIVDSARGDVTEAARPQVLDVLAGVMQKSSAGAFTRADQTVAERALQGLGLELGVAKSLVLQASTPLAMAGSQRSSPTRAPADVEQVLHEAPRELQAAARVLLDDPYFKKLRPTATIETHSGEGGGYAYTSLNVAIQNPFAPYNPQGFDNRFQIHLIKYTEETAGGEPYIVMAMGHPDIRISTSLGAGYPVFEDRRPKTPGGLVRAVRAILRRPDVSSFLRQWVQAKSLTDVDKAFVLPIVQRVLRVAQGATESQVLQFVQRAYRAPRDISQEEFVTQLTAWGIDEGQARAYWTILTTPTAMAGSQRGGEGTREGLTAQSDDGRVRISLVPMPVEHQVNVTHQWRVTVTETGVEGQHEFPTLRTAKGTKVLEAHFVPGTYEVDLTVESAERPGETWTHRIAALTQSFVNDVVAEHEQLLAERGGLSPEELQQRQFVLIRDRLEAKYPTRAAELTQSLQKLAATEDASHDDPLRRPRARSARVDDVIKGLPAEITLTERTFFRWALEVPIVKPQAAGRAAGEEPAAGRTPQAPAATPAQPMAAPAEPADEQQALDAIAAYRREHPVRAAMGGNWKMNDVVPGDKVTRWVAEGRIPKEDAGRVAMQEEYLPALSRAIAGRESVDVTFFIPYTEIEAVIEAFNALPFPPNVVIGAQDSAPMKEQKGAFTGRISVEQLKALGVKEVLVGHSELRTMIDPATGERVRDPRGLTHAEVVQEIRNIRAAGLKVTLAIGETQDERQRGLTVEVIDEHLREEYAPLTDGERDPAFFKIAYEPVWAIGKGKQPATPEQAEAVHRQIAIGVARLAGVERAAATRILYGGNMNPANVNQLLAQPHIDGGLVGGASLKSGDFGTLVQAPAAKKVAQAVFALWRRSYDVAPPPDETGFSESLKDTYDRVVPYFERAIMSLVKQGRHVLLGAHGNGFRAIAMALFGITPEEVEGFTFPLGTAVHIQFNTDGTVAHVYILETERQPDPERVDDLENILKLKHIPVTRRPLDGRLDDTLREQFQLHAPGVGSLTLLRHGQTEASETLPHKGFFAGWLNVPLTPAGRQDAQEAGRLMATLRIPVELAFSSDLDRAYDTMTEALGAMGSEVPITKEVLLRERDYGALAGRMRKEFMDELAGRIASLWQDEPALRTADARTIAQRLSERWHQTGKLEAGSRKLEARSQKPEVGSRKLEAGTPERGAATAALVDALIREVRAGQAPGWMAVDYQPGRVRVHAEGDDLDSIAGRIREADAYLERATNDSSTRERVRNALTLLGADPRATELTLAEFTGVAIRLVKRLTGREDTFAEHKRQLDAAVQALYESIRPTIMAITDRDQAIRAAMVYAAIGNLFDLTNPRAIQNIAASLGESVDLTHGMNDESLKRIVAAVFQRASSDRLIIDQLADFLQRIKQTPGGTILYFLDNHGEVIFDQLLIEQFLLAGYRVAVVGRVEEVQEDVTDQEARMIFQANPHLARYLADGRLAVVTDGSYFLGVNLKQSPQHPEFLNAWRQSAGLIVKGGGAFQTLFGERLSRPALFVRMMKGSDTDYRSLQATRGLDIPRARRTPFDAIFLYQEEDPTFKTDSEEQAERGAAGAESFRRQIAHEFNSSPGHRGRFETLFKDDGKERGGWVKRPWEVLASNLPEEVEREAAKLRSEGVEVLSFVGMGGESSSIGPSDERVINVNSTATKKLGRVLAGHDLSKIHWFVVSKGGVTTETSRNAAYLERVYRGRSLNPTQFITYVTDPGTPFEDKRAEGFSVEYRELNGQTSVGGRWILVNHSPLLAYAWRHPEPGTVRSMLEVLTKAHTFADGADDPWIAAAASVLPLLQTGRPKVAVIQPDAMGRARRVAMEQNAEESLGKGNLGFTLYTSRQDLDTIHEMEEKGWDKGWVFVEFRVTGHEQETQVYTEEARRRGEHVITIPINEADLNLASQIAAYGWMKFVAIIGGLWGINFSKQESVEHYKELMLSKQLTLADVIQPAAQHRAVVEDDSIILVYDGLLPYLSGEQKTELTKLQEAKANLSVIYAKLLKFTRSTFDAQTLGYYDDVDDTREDTWLEGLTQGLIHRKLYYAAKSGEGTPVLHGPFENWFDGPLHQIPVHLVATDHEQLEPGYPEGAQTLIEGAVAAHRVLVEANRPSVMLIVKGKLDAAGREKVQQFFEGVLAAGTPQPATPPTPTLPPSVAPALRTSSDRDELVRGLQQNSTVKTLLNQHGIHPSDRRFDAAIEAMAAYLSHRSPRLLSEGLERAGLGFDAAGHVANGFVEAERGAVLSAPSTQHPAPSTGPAEAERGAARQTFPFSAAIFDSDGVIIDTTWAHQQSWKEALGEYGLEVTDALYDSYLNATDPKMSLRRLMQDGLLKAALSEEDLAALITRRRQRYQTVVSAQPVPTFPSTITLIEEFRRTGVKMGVGSASGYTPTLLHSAGVDGQFDTIVTGREVPQGKPAPDLYMETAARLGVKPSEAVVIGDAVSVVSDLGELTPERLSELAHERSEGQAGAARRIEIAPEARRGIKFGTAGWRSEMPDVTGEAPDFSTGQNLMTLERIQAMAQVFADALNARSARGDYAGKAFVVPVGFDGRTHSREFAEAVSKILAGNRIRVALIDFTKYPHGLPTPILAFLMKHLNAVAAVDITASHNKATDNGIELRNGLTGGQFLPEDMAEMAANLQQVPFIRAAASVDDPLIQLVDPLDAYVDYLRGLVDVTAIQAARLEIGYDAIHGMGYIVPEVFKRLGIDSPKVLLRGQPREDFGDPTRQRGAEPNAEALAELATRVVGERLASGHSGDGDHDRAGVILSDGRWLSPNEFYAWILFEELSQLKAEAERSGRAWDPTHYVIGRTVGSTHHVDAIARHFGIPPEQVIETKVGFKFLNELINEQATKGKTVVVAFEESGGGTFAGAMADKDGILVLLKLLEIDARAKVQGQTSAQRYDAFRQVVPQPLNVRSQFTLKDRGAQTGPMMDRLQQGFIDLSKAALEYGAFGPVERVRTDDGAKFFFMDGSWILLRRSGTEPLFRVYIEAATPAVWVEHAQRVIDYLRVRGLTDAELHDLEEDKAKVEQGAVEQATGHTLQATGLEPAAGSLEPVHAERGATTRMVPAATVAAIQRRFINGEITEDEIRLMLRQLGVGSMLIQEVIDVGSKERAYANTGSRQPKPERGAAAQHAASSRPQAAPEAGSQKPGAGSVQLDAALQGVPAELHEAIRLIWSHPLISGLRPTIDTVTLDEDAVRLLQFVVPATGTKVDVAVRHPQQSDEALHLVVSKTRLASNPRTQRETPPFLYEIRASIGPEVEATLIDLQNTEQPERLASLTQEVLARLERVEGATLQAWRAPARAAAEQRVVDLVEAGAAQPPQSPTDTPGTATEGVMETAGSI